MMSDTVSVRVLRPICVRGERVEAGTVLKLPAAAAATMIGTPRCELVNDRDRDAIALAVMHETAVTLRRAQAPAFIGPPADPRWQSHL